VIAGLAVAAPAASAADILCDAASQFDIKYDFRAADDAYGVQSGTSIKTWSNTAWGAVAGNDGAYGERGGRVPESYFPDAQWIVIDPPRHGEVVQLDSRTFEYKSHAAKDETVVDSFTYRWRPYETMAAKPCSNLATVTLYASPNPPMPKADSYVVEGDAALQAGDPTTLTGNPTGVLSNDLNTVNQTNENLYAVLDEAMPLSYEATPTFYGKGDFVWGGGSPGTAQNGSFFWRPGESTVFGRYRLPYRACYYSQTGLPGQSACSSRQVATEVYVKPVLTTKPDYYTVAVSESANVDVGDNDFNNLLDPSFALTRQPIHGTASLAADGRLIYEPEAGFQGVDSLAYVSCGIATRVVGASATCSGDTEVYVKIGTTPDIVVTGAFRAGGLAGQPFEWFFSDTVRANLSQLDPFFNVRQGVQVRPEGSSTALSGTYQCLLATVTVPCTTTDLWNRIRFTPSSPLTAGARYTLSVNNGLNWIGRPSDDGSLIVKYVQPSVVTIQMPVALTDTTPPTTSIASGPSTTTAETSATFEVWGDDDNGIVSGFQCALDGAAFTSCGSPASYTGLGDGSHTLLARAVNGDGVVDPTPASYTWLVDTVPPSATVTSGPDPSSTTDSATLEFTGLDGSGSGVAGFRCRLDAAAFAPCTSPVTYTGLADGPHNFLVYAVDAAGNEPAVSSLYTWTVDTGAVLDTVDPETAIGSTPANPSSSSAAAFGFSGTDDSGAVAGFECSLDGGAFAACAAPKAYSALVDGSHTFQVRAVDAAGNTDATPATSTWVVDTAAPDTSILATPTNPAASSAASFSFAGIDGAGSGVASFQCSVDGAAFSACASPQSYTALSDGSHTFQVRAVDAAGNVDATPATFTWLVDATAPDTTITSNPPAVTTSSGASFSFTGTDSAGEVLSFQCSLDNAAFTACTSPSTYTGLSSNQHTFRVRAVDAAGNVDATPATYRWQADYVSPETILMGRPANPSSSSMATFSFNGFDGTGSGVASFRCSLDGRAFTECGVRTQAQTYTDLADGSHTFQVQAVDAANNGDPTPASYTWVIDTSAPTTAITSTPDALTPSTSAAFSFTGGDAGGGALVFECRLDGGSFAACSSPQSYSALAQGSHTFDVRAVDAAGNADPTPATFTWEVGKLPQTITFGALGDKVEGDPGFSLSATASSGLTVAFGSSTTDVCTVSGTAVTLVGAGTCTIVAAQDGDATFEPAASVTRSFDVASGIALAAPGSVQYSDRLAVSATVTGKHAGTVAFTLDGAAFCTATASTLTGEASCSAVVPKPAGSYDVRARFTPTDPLRGPVSATRQVTVDAESATVGYTGPQLVTTATSSATTASVALRAVVTQADDGTPGDLTKAKVVFDIFRSTNLTTTPDQSVAVSASSTGVATASVTLGLDSFVVVPRLSTAAPVYFAGPRGDAQVVTVAQPLSGASASGGGWVIDPGTGSVPVAISPTNPKGSFGLNVRYKKGTTTPTGQVVYTFRGADGYVYIMKSTSWVSGAAAFRSGAASFSGKANVTVLDPRTGQIVSGLGGGNFSYRIDVTDGSTDTYALRLYDAKGRLYHLVGTPGANGAVTPVAVKAGNITVRTR
jgi:hypothetical protein